MIAAENGHTEVIKMLVRAGSDIHRQGKQVQKFRVHVNGIL
jgi:ankyrin repeat protein